MDQKEQGQGDQKNRCLETRTTKLELKKEKKTKKDRVANKDGATKVKKQ